MKTLTLKLPNALAARLVKASQRARRTKSDMVREAIEIYLDGKPEPKRDSFLDRAGDLLGCIDSGITDLGHNPKHMEGFGR